MTDCAGVQYPCAFNVCLQTECRWRGVWRGFAAVFSLVFHGAKGEATPLAFSEWR